MTSTIANARLLDAVPSDGNVDILVENGRVERVAPAGGGRARGEPPVFDAEGAFAAPGYIDIHSHGGAGSDIMDATREAIATVARFHLSRGTTSFLATTLAAPLPSISRTFDALRDFMRSPQPGCAAVLGAHLEGPFLAPGNAGAQDRRWLRTPDAEAADFVLANADLIRRVTLAPELEGGLALIRRLRAAGIGVSAGHDAAIDDEILAAIEAGLDAVTHIYCCSSGISRRAGPRKHLGLTEMGMADDRLVAEVIADRRAVPDLLFDLIWKAKGRDRICLVSDSTRVAGMPDGEYRLGDAETGILIEKRGDEAYVPALGVYAGSVTDLAQSVRNLVAHNALSLADAVHMATAVPARLLGLPDRGRIAPGMIADLNLIDPAGRVLATFIRGERA
jgi:N-acetylglucosamine-6-phosphate deacetylase